MRLAARDLRSLLALESHSRYGSMNAEGDQAKEYMAEVQKSTLDMIHEEAEILDLRLAQRKA
jgi:hypothetical protein